MKYPNHPWRRAQKNEQVIKKVFAEKELAKTNRFLAKKGKPPVKTNKRLRSMKSSRKEEEGNDTEQRTTRTG